MPLLKITDDILAPTDTLKIKFKGKNPFVAMAMVRDLIRSVMKIQSKDILETDVRWDVTGKIPGFYGKWMGKRNEDQWTTTSIRVIIQGEQNSQDKMGEVEVQLKGAMTTEFEYSNFIQRAFWWFYNRAFYHKQRQLYLEYDKDNMYQMKEEFQRAFKLID